MKRMRILDYVLLLHLFELREEKMDWWARLVFLASIVLFGFSLIFSLMHLEQKAILASISYFISSLLSFLVASLDDSDTRARLLWLATVVMLLGSIILLVTLLTLYTTAPLLTR